MFPCKDIRHFFALLRQILDIMRVGAHEGETTMLARILFEISISSYNTRERELGVEKR
jgi:hypothetical protein